MRKCTSNQLFQNKLLWAWFVDVYLKTKIERNIGWVFLWGGNFLGRTISDQEVVICNAVIRSEKHVFHRTLNGV